MNRKQKKGKPTCRCIAVEKPIDTTCRRSDILIRYQLQKSKLDIALTQKNALAHFDFLKEELKNVEKDIRAIEATIYNLEVSQSNEDLNCQSRKRKSDINKIKSSLKKDLSHLRHQECDLRRQFIAARTACRDARIDELLVNEEIKRLNEQCWEEYCMRKDHLSRQRLSWEEKSKKNAIFVREATISSVANSITSHVFQKLPGDHSLSSKQMRESSNARRSIETFIAKSFEKAREQKIIEATEHQLRYRRQAQNLLKFKQNLNGISMYIKKRNQNKQSENDKIAQEKEEVKTLLMARGTNPYLADYLFVLEEKQREMQRKMLMDEQNKLNEMHREYSTIEKSKSKEDSDRKKWDEFWSKSAKQKSLKDKKDKHEMYYGSHSEGSGKKSEKAESPKEGKRLSGKSEKDEQNHNEDEIHPSVSNKKSDENAGEAEVHDIDNGNKQGAIKSDAVADGKPEQNSQQGAGQGQQGLPTRKAVHLELRQKESLLNLADENSKAVLMNRGQSVFDFGEVLVGERKYIAVNVANIGPEVVKLKMSALNPYGPFTFCNSLKDIPPDSYFSFKYKYEPTEPGQAQEIVKIEEVDKHENFMLIKLMGYAVQNIGD